MLGDDAEIVQFRVIVRGHFYHDSPDLIGSHLQSFPDFMVISCLKGGKLGHSFIAIIPESSVELLTQLEIGNGPGKKGVSQKPTFHKVSLQAMLLCEGKAEPPPPYSVNPGVPGGSGWRGWPRLPTGDGDTESRWWRDAVHRLESSIPTHHR
jgi:hypothetical protein